jgi:hypothetical protein
VPTPAGGPVRDAAPIEWDEDFEHTDRRWWMPILVAILAMLLLAVLGFGLWLILRSAVRGPAPITPPAATASSSPTTAPTPTTEPPTPGPTTEATLQVPPLVGLPEATARAVLDQFGLTYRLQFRSSGKPPGTVIETDPAPGTTISRDQQITLVIADGPTSRPTNPTASPSGA